MAKTINRDYTECLTSDLAKKILISHNKIDLGKAGGLILVSNIGEREREREGWEKN